MRHRRRNRQSHWNHGNRRNYELDRAIEKLRICAFFIVMSCIVYTAAFIYAWTR